MMHEDDEEAMTLQQRSFTALTVLALAVLAKAIKAATEAWGNFMLIFY